MPSLMVPITPSAAGGESKYQREYGGPARSVLKTFHFMTLLYSLLDSGGLGSLPVSPAPEKGARILRRGEKGDDLLNEG